MQKNLRNSRTLFLCILLSIFGSSTRTSIAQDAPLDIDFSDTEISIPDSVRLLMEAITEAETQEDSFDPKLGELSFDLGIQLETLGLNVQALNAFQRSDQSTKIREGLYSENREISVRKIYEQHLALNDWDAAATSLNTVAWIKARNYDSNSLEYVPVLQELILWSLAEDEQVRDDEKGVYLRAAHDDLEKIYAIHAEIDQPLDKQSLDLATTINHRLALHGVMNSNLEGLRVQQGRRQVQIAERACEGLYAENEESQEICMDEAKDQVYFNTPKRSSGVAERQTLGNTQQLSAVQEYFSSQSWEVTEIDNSVELNNNPALAFFAQSYYRGKEVLLDQLDELKDGDDKAATLDSLLALGDWYLLFGYFKSAVEVYATAWTFADQAGLGGSINAQQPVPISITSLVDVLPKLDSGHRKGYAKASIIVAPTGEVDGVEILETDIQDEETIAELVAELSMSRYRPTLNMGVPAVAISYIVERQVSY